MSNAAPFDIPAINNEKEVLIRHLGLDSADDTQRSLVKEAGIEKLSAWHRASFFAYGDARYRVTHISAGMKGDVAREFNSNWWVLEELSGEH